MNTDKVKERCSDCFALVDNNNEWWCDIYNCPCSEVKNCKEWDNDRGDIE